MFRKKKQNSFINDSDRIARRDYQPTDDDVIRARLRTLGVQEYKFIFDHGAFLSNQINGSLISYIQPLFLFFCNPPSRPNNGTGMEIVRCWWSKKHCTFYF